MADTTHISWADATHNHWIGCTKVSLACDGCFAEHLMDTRHHRVTWGKPGQPGTLSLTSEANRRKPLMWNRKAAAAGTRPFVFCSSLSDVFDNNVPAEWRADLFKLIGETPHLVWLLLTKRPQNIIKMIYDAGGMPPHARNIALGTTVEDQIRANINVPHLCEAKMALAPLFTFLSCEPLLGGIYLRSIDVKPGRFSFLDPADDHFDALYPHAPWKVGWIITGGETDQGAHQARPWNPEWARSLRDQCEDTATAFHHKQNGEWVYKGFVGASGWTRASEKGGAVFGRLSAGGFGEQTPVLGGAPFETRFPFRTEHDPGPCVVKVGKARSGRLIDGVIHDARPEMRR